MWNQRFRFSVISGFSFWALYPKTEIRKSRKFIENPKILKYENKISKTLEILFKWHHSQNHSATMLIICYISFSRDSDTSRFVKLSLRFFFCFFFFLLWLFFFVCLFVYSSFNAQNVEIVIEKQIHMYLNFIDPKIQIFRDFWVFVLSPISKDEILEIMEILQKRHDTEIWECSFKNSWNSVEMTSKLSSHIINHEAGIWVTFKRFWPSGAKINKPWLLLPAYVIVLVLNFKNQL